MYIAICISYPLLICILIISNIFQNEWKNYVTSRAVEEASVWILFEKQSSRETIHFRSLFRQKHPSKHHLKDNKTRWEWIWTPKKVWQWKNSKVITKKAVEKLKRMFDYKDAISQRQAAREFNCSQKHICRTLLTKTKIRARKKIRIPKRSEQQKALAKLSAVGFFKNYKIDHSLWTMNPISLWLIQASTKMINFTLAM